MRRAERTCKLLRPSFHHSLTQCLSPAAADWFGRQTTHSRKNAEIGHSPTVRLETLRKPRRRFGGGGRGGRGPNWPGKFRRQEAGRANRWSRVHRMAIRPDRSGPCRAVPVRRDWFETRNAGEQVNGKTAFLDATRHSHPRTRTAGKRRAALPR